MAIPTGLESYQTVLEVATLYYVKNSGRGTERQTSGIEVKGGTVNIYGSFDEVANLPSPPTNMTLTASGFAGIDTFEIIPTYLYIATVTGTPEIIVSSIEAEAVV